MIHWFVQRITYLATLIGIKTGCLAAIIFPRQWLFVLSDGLAWLGFGLFRGFRQKSLNNLAFALGERFAGTAEETARKSLRNFFRACVEIAIAMKTPAEEHRREIPLVGRDHLDAALAKGTGAIILSAHLGNFFLVGKRLAAEGYEVYVLVNQPKYGKFAKLMDDYRLQVGQQTIHARPRRQALRELLQILRRNQIAVIIADEFRNRKGIPASFFGGTVLARRGPATLTARTGAPVIPAYLVRGPADNLTLIIEPELVLQRSEKNKNEVRENTQRLTQWLERTVRRYPDQWNWMSVHWQDGARGSQAPREHHFQTLTDSFEKGDIKWRSTRRNLRN